MPKVFDFTPQNAFLIVRDAARKAEVGEVRPHDLRRTYAKLSRAGGAPLEQVSATLGHSSLVTTQRYLGSNLELSPGQGCGDFIEDPTNPTKED
jgi:integrase